MAVFTGCVKEQPNSVGDAGNFNENAVIIESFSVSSSMIHFTSTVNGDWDEVADYDLYVYIKKSGVWYNDSEYDKVFSGISSSTYSDSVEFVGGAAGSKWQFAVASVIRKGGDTVIGVSDRKFFEIETSLSGNIVPGLTKGSSDTTVSNVIYFDITSSMLQAGYDSIALFGTSKGLSPLERDSIAFNYDIFRGDSIKRAAISSAVGVSSSPELTLNDISEEGQLLNLPGKVYWKIRKHSAGRRFFYIKLYDGSGNVKFLESSVQIKDFQVEIGLSTVVNVEKKDIFSLKPVRLSSYNEPLTDAPIIQVSFPDSLNREAVSDSFYIWLIYKEEGNFSDASKIFDNHTDTSLLTFNSSNSETYRETRAVIKTLGPEDVSTVSFDLNPVLQKATSGHTLTGSASKLGSLTDLDTISRIISRDSGYIPIDDGGDLFKLSIFGKYSTAHDTLEYFAGESVFDFFEESVSLPELKGPSFIRPDGTYRKANLYNKCGFKEIGFVALFKNKYFDNWKLVTNKSGYGKTVGYDCAAPATIFYSSKHDFEYDLRNNPFLDIRDVMALYSSGLSLESIESTLAFDDYGGGVVRDSLLLAFDVFDMGGSEVTDLECWIAPVPLTYSADSSSVTPDTAILFEASSSSGAVYGEPLVEGAARLFGSYDVLGLTGIDLLTTDPYGRFIKPEQDFSEENKWERDTRIVVRNMSRFKNGLYRIWFITEDARGNRQLAVTGDNSLYSESNYSSNPFYIFIFNE
ncbi:MAG: hypothetical protein ACLFQK_03615 [Fibrobacterota bacterium]